MAPDAILPGCCRVPRRRRTSLGGVPSEVHLIGNARAYYEAWLGLNDEDVLRWTLLDLAQRQEANEHLLDTKATRMRFAATAVAFETLFLFVGVVTVAV